jgi:hypothetical protein
MQGGGHRGVGLAFPLGLERPQLVDQRGRGHAPVLQPPLRGDHLHHPRAGRTDELALHLHPFAQAALLDEVAGEAQPDPRLVLRGGRAVDLRPIRAGDELVQAQPRRQRGLAVPARHPEHPALVDAAAAAVALVELGQELLLPALKPKRLPDQRPARVRQELLEEPGQLLAAPPPTQHRQLLVQQRCRIRRRGRAGLLPDLAHRALDLERDRAPLRFTGRSPVGPLPLRKPGIRNIGSGEQPVVAAGTETAVTQKPHQVLGRPCHQRPPPRPSRAS